MNKMRKTTGKMTMLFGAATIAVTAAAAPTIAITGAQQRYPWNNIVDVTYKLANAGTNPDTYAVVLTTTINGAEVELSNGCEPSTNGTHTAICVIPEGLQATGLKVTGKVYEMAKCVPAVGTVDEESGAVTNNNDYIIVDLDNGGETYEAKLDYQALSNRRYKSLDYMTGKMVFRKLPAGTYRYYNAGVNSSGAPNAQTSVPETGYWMAIYPCTEGQYTRLSKAAATNDSVTVQTYVSYNTIVGTPYATMAALTGTTGKYALPDEGRWEAACRAGRTDAFYHWGDNWDGDMGTTVQKGAVARFVPNRWGFYDMNGTVCEWVSTTNGGYRFHRSGGDGGAAMSPSNVTSSFRGSSDPNVGSRGSIVYGFRLARVAR